MGQVGAAKAVLVSKKRGNYGVLRIFFIWAHSFFTPSSLLWLCLFLPVFFYIQSPSAVKGEGGVHVQTPNGYETKEWE
jgi:hypothetical protein